MVKMVYDGCIAPNPADSSDGFLAFTLMHQGSAAKWPRIGVKHIAGIRRLLPTSGRKVNYGISG